MTNATTATETTTAPTAEGVAQEARMLCAPREWLRCASYRRAWAAKLPASLAHEAKALTAARLVQAYTPRAEELVGPVALADIRLTLERAVHLLGQR